MWGGNAYLVKNKKRKKKRKKSGCVITNCITVVLLPWIHSIKMQTFDSVCCDIVENCNIVTVFSTYIWILFALIIKLWWSFHLCPCSLKVVNNALHKTKMFWLFLGTALSLMPLVMLLLLLHVWPCNNTQQAPTARLSLGKCMPLVQDSANCVKSRGRNPRCGGCVIFGVYQCSVWVFPPSVCAPIWDEGGSRVSLSLEAT